MRYIVHVNRHHLAANAKDGGHRPVYSVKAGGPRGAVTYAHAVVIRGTCTLIDPRTAGSLPCGARAWLDVEGEVDLVDPCSFAEVDQAA